MRPPLRSCGQGSWLQIQRSGFDSWHHQIFWEVTGLDRGPLSLWVQMRRYFKEKVAARVQKTEITSVGISRADYATPFYPQNVGTNFVDKWRLLGRYSLIEDSDHGVVFVICNVRGLSSRLFKHPLSILGSSAMIRHLLMSLINVSKWMLKERLF
jgi:hypothetical protein